MRIVTFLYCFLICISVYAWPNDSTVLDSKVLFSEVSFDNFKKQAAFENKPYFIMFSASWCSPCKRIKKEIFTHPKIAAIANEHFLVFEVDIESFDGLEINNEFKVSQLPTILFFDPKGKPIDKATGFFDAYYFFKKLRAKIPPHLRTIDWDHTYID